MPNTKDISLAMVSYHNAEDIIPAIESIEEHTDAEIQKQILIIDNADEPELFRGLVEKYDDVTYVNPGENIGYARGNNYIIDQLDSRYHVIANPDIMFTEDSLKKIIQYMDDTVGIGMVIPKIIGQDGELLPIYRKELTLFDLFTRRYLKGLFKSRIAKHTLSDQDYSEPFQVPFGQGSFLVIRTDLFRQLNGFDENYFLYVEDADLCKRVNRYSKLIYYPDTTVMHKWKRGSATDRDLLKAHIKSVNYYFKKWGVKLF
ncbi:MAG: glycosyltransferase [Lachnospiraceae bacterium]|nr:glycosyltransferase [Lachnospiraceae bacterium]